MITRYSLPVVAVLACASIAAAGDLTPPAGPVQATDRVVLNAQTITLPHTITASGSYVLTSNLQNSTGVGDGIIINADFVTLDLNGFSIRGSVGTGAGIYIIGSSDHATIRNGTLFGWGSAGINAGGAGNHTIEKVGVFGNSAAGIFATQDCQIIDCVAEGNVGNGMSAQTGSLISGCTARSNGAHGISASDGVEIRMSVAHSNTSNGFNIGANCVVSECVSENNGNNGILTLNNSLVLNSTSRNNVNGYFGSAGTRFESCLASDNDQDGFTLDGRGGAVVNCSSLSNGIFGIDTADGSLILNNNCDSNGSSGISLGGADSRIEANTCSNNGFGIAAAGGGSFNNLIIKNTCRGSTVGANFVPISNPYGPIITVGGGGDISVVAGSDHPWANFEF